MHPKLFEMIGYAKSKGIKEVSFLTNALLLTPGNARKIVENQVDWVTISFDGWGKTYENIRRPAKYDEALERIRMLQEIKKQEGSVKPVVNVQTIWPAIQRDPQKFFGIFDNIADRITVNPFTDFYNPEYHPDPEWECSQLTNMFSKRSQHFHMLWKMTRSDSISTCRLEPWKGDKDNEDVYSYWVS